MSALLQPIADLADTEGILAAVDRLEITVKPFWQADPMPGDRYCEWLECLRWTDGYGYTFLRCRLC